MTFFIFFTANVFKFFSFFFTANVHHFLYSLLKKAATSKQSIPSKSLSKVGKPKQISAKSLHN
jgi:hypothetical protein